MSVITVTFERITKGISFREVVGVTEALDAQGAISKLFPSDANFLKRLEWMRINVYFDIVPEIDSSSDFLGILDAKKREFDRKYG